MDDVTSLSQDTPSMNVSLKDSDNPTYPSPTTKFYSDNVKNWEDTIAILLVDLLKIVCEEILANNNESLIPPEDEEVLLELEFLGASV